MATLTELDALAPACARLPGVRAKADIGLVAEVLGGGDWYAGPGDDGAVLPDGDGSWWSGGGDPARVRRRRPVRRGGRRGAGQRQRPGGDGRRPVALLDTVVGTEDVAREILRGMRWAAERYDVPIVGGHLTRTDGPPRSRRSASAAPTACCRPPPPRPDRCWCSAAASTGAMRADFLFFPSFEQRGDRLAGDVRLLAELARRRAPRSPPRT